MKMENFTLNAKTQWTSLVTKSLMLVAMVFVSFGLQAQCPLGCNNNVQVSLDANCEATVTPDMILEGQGTDPSCTYVVTILDQNDVPIPTSPTVNGSHIGMTLKARVTLGANSCWGYITVEDKLAPVLTCLDDVDMYCNDELASNIMTAFSSNSYSNTTSVAIPDGGSVDVPFAVSGANQVAVVESFSGTLNYTHTVSTSQVDVSFISPAGDTYASMADIPGAQNLNGYWIVRFTDNNADGNGGTFNSGTINISARGFLASSFIYDENCDAATVTKTSDDTEDIECGDSSYPLYSARRTVCYMAEDPSGNVSTECCFSINYLRRDLGDVVFPGNVDIPCEVNYDSNGNDYPDPDEGSGVYEIGSPSIDGRSIYPNDGFCEINVTYSDTRIDVCENTFKVLRNWVALDWCTGQIVTSTQIIKILDEEGPVVNCPSDFFFEEANPYTCTADHVVQPPNVIFDCGSYTYTVNYLIGGEAACDIAPPTGPFVNTNVVGPAGGPYTITDLPLGCTWIQYLVEDDCGNVTECRREVRVVDNTPPTPVCDETTVVTLTDNGWAHIFAQSFDDGSHDNCSSDITFQVQRMTAGCGTPGGWKDYEQFCCADIGNEVMVALLVTDSNGNSNSCMVNVVVQDKIDPVITCPPNITVDCAEQTGIAYTGSATATDNCGTVTVTSSDSGGVNNCGEGTITRTWRAEDAGGRTVSCTQFITVQDMSPFSGASINWPADRDLSGCMGVDTDPSNPLLGYPQYNDDACSLVAHTYDDQVFTFVDGACFKILRTWTVIDWCQYDENNPFAGGIWQDVQVIKVNNSNAPVFDNCSTLNFCVYDDGCQGYVDLIGQATDECTPDSELVWSYQIKPDGSSSYGSIQSGNNASGTYPVGNHMIRWFVEDQCGNVSECIQNFNVNDCKNPTPYCISGITTVVMPSTGEIAIWASDFDLGSFDNCPGNLSFSFSSSTFNTSMTFDCDDLGIQTVEIWVTDANGNQDYCETMINIQANNGACGSISGGAMVSGSITTEGAEAVENVEVMLEDMLDGVQTYFMTSTDGNFAFDNVTTGLDYEISASKNDDYMNGVSTLDLVLIQKHILQTQTLDSPYKIIAADVNNNGDISAIDLIELRKLILGIYEELPSNESWRFVDANETFVDLDSPFPFTEVIYVSSLENDEMTNNYIAVKIGDVNGNAVVNFADNGAEFRSSASLDLLYDDKVFEAGDVVELTLSSDEFNAIVGLQYTLNFDAAKLEFAGHTSNAIQVTDANFGLTQVNNGQLSMSWHDIKGQTTSDALYTIEFKALQSGSLSGAINLSSDITTAEAYNSNLETMDVTIQARGTELTVFNLGQNKPNPFATTTVVEFTLPEAMQAQLTVYDITGKVLKQYNEFYQKGVNTLTMNIEELSTTGVLYYRLDAGDNTATKKMIILTK